MNRLASKPQPRRTTPRIVAKLDLSDELKRELHGFFQRMHTGRWPTLRTLALRQTPDGTLIEAAEWLRQEHSRFTIIEWAVLDGRQRRLSVHVPGPRCCVGLPCAIWLIVGHISGRLAGDRGQWLVHTGVVRAAAPPTTTRTALCVRSIASRMLPPAIATDALFV